MRQSACCGWPKSLTCLPRGQSHLTLKYLLKSSHERAARCSLHLLYSGNITVPYPCCLEKLPQILRRTSNFFSNFFYFLRPQGMKSRRVNPVPGACFTGIFIGFTGNSGENYGALGEDSFALSNVWFWTCRFRGSTWASLLAGIGKIRKLQFQACGVLFLIF